MSACEKAERRRDRIEASRFGVLLGNALIDAADFARAEDLLGRTLQLAEEVRDPSCGPASTGSSRGCTPSRMTGSGAAEYARKDTCDRRAGRGSLVHRAPTSCVSSTVTARQRRSRSWSAADPYSTMRHRWKRPSTARRAPWPPREERKRRSRSDRDRVRLRRPRIGAPTGSNGCVRGLRQRRGAWRGRLPRARARLPPGLPPPSERRPAGAGRARPAGASASSPGRPSRS